MASRSGTANGANRDVERAYESGRRAIRCGAGLVCDTMRARTACVLTDRDGVRATDRDDERHGAGPDGERTVGTAFDMRCGYDRRVRTVRFGTMCERDGAGAAGVAGRVHGFGATGGDADLYGRLRSTSPNAVVYSWSTRQLLGHPRGLVGVSEVCRLGALILCENQPVVFF